MQRMSAPTISAPTVATLIAASLFFLLLLACTYVAPLTFDDAYNSNVALSLAKGRGYGTYTGGSFVAFNPLISTGVFFIAPFALPLRLLGPSIDITQLYSLVVTFLFFSISLHQASKLHRYLPLVVIVLSATFLVNGKTDLVANTQVAGIPAPPYGLWFQCIGNMAGTWALIAATLGCVSRTGSKRVRIAIIFFCMAFACNAKIIHALPGGIALLTLLLCSPKRYWQAVAVGYVGILIGMQADSWLAWLTLGSASFQVHRANAQGFVASNIGVYAQLLRSPSIDGLQEIVGTIPANFPAAIASAGRALCLFTALVAGVLLVGCAVNRGTRYSKELFHVSLVCGSAGAAVLVWWSGIPLAPERFLTCVPPLIVMSLAAAFLAVFQGVSFAWRVGVSLGMGALTAYGVYQTVEQFLAAGRIGKIVRAEQREVANLIKVESHGDKKSPLCGEGWWHPHEISFLTASPRTISCALDRARRVVIPKHIFPVEVSSQMVSLHCEPRFSGTYYDVAFCRRLNPP
jgi:hypothetical protein